MRPASRVSTRERRRAWRGVKAGRHLRQVQTAYGSGQKLRERTAAHSARCAARRLGLAEEDERIATAEAELAAARRDLDRIQDAIEFCAAAASAPVRMVRSML
jgi:hypothetical protein